MLLTEKAQISDEVLSFDLDRVVAYAIQNHPELLNYDINAITLQFRQFMFLCAKSKKPLAVPSELVDHIWHAALKINRVYDTYCEMLGKKIYHEPHTKEVNPAQKKVLRHNLLKASAFYFGKNVFTSFDEETNCGDNCCGGWKNSQASNCSGGSNCGTNCSGTGCWGSCSGNR